MKEEIECSANFILFIIAVKLKKKDMKLLTFTEGEIFKNSLISLFFQNFENLWNINAPLVGTHHRTIMIGKTIHPIMAQSWKKIRKSQKQLKKLLPNFIIWIDPNNVMVKLIKHLPPLTIFSRKNNIHFNLNLPANTNATPNNKTNIFIFENYLHQQKKYFNSQYSTLIEL